MRFQQSNVTKTPDANRKTKIIWFDLSYSFNVDTKISEKIFKQKSEFSKTI